MHSPAAHPAPPAPAAPHTPWRGWIGYLSGFPWLLLPPALLSLGYGLLTQNRRMVADRIALLRLMMRGADTYCSLIWLARGFYWTADPNRPPSSFSVVRPEITTRPDAVCVADITLPIGVGDFDADHQLVAPQTHFYRFLAHLPAMRADHRPIASYEEYQRLIQDVFGRTFVAYRPLIGDPDSAELLRAYFFEDYGSPWLSREGDRFVVDLSHYDDLEIDDPSRYERYGGRLEFDADLQDVSITVRGVRYTPDHPEWSRVRYAFVSTALIAVVIEQHTIHIHYHNAALFGLAHREHLPSDHPIYRLLRPFTLNSVSINEHAVFVILEQSGILLHGTALTWSSLECLYQHAAASYRHEPMPDYLRRAGLLEPEGHAAPGVVFAEESLHTYSIIERFVRDYVTLYYPDDAAVKADPALEAFWGAIVDGLPSTAGVAPRASHDGLVDMLGTFIWNVTFWHDYTSQTGNSILDYRLAGVVAKRPDVYGTPYPNIQEQLLALLAHQLTTVQGPKINDDFSHFWLDDGAKEIAQRFRRDLDLYKQEVTTRNASRERSFDAFNPDIIESSVQT